MRRCAFPILLFLCCLAATVWFSRGSVAAQNAVSMQEARAHAGKFPQPPLIVTFEERLTKQGVNGVVISQRGRQVCVGRGKFATVRTAGPRERRGI